MFPLPIKLGLEVAFVLATQFYHMVEPMIMPPAHTGINDNTKIDDRLTPGHPLQLSQEVTAPVQASCEAEDSALSEDKLTTLHNSLQSIRSQLTAMELRDTFVIEFYMGESDEEITANSPAEFYSRAFAYDEIYPNNNDAAALQYLSEDPQHIVDVSTAYVAQIGALEEMFPYYAAELHAQLKTEIETVVAISDEVRFKLEPGEMSDVCSMPLFIDVPLRDGYQI